MTVVNIFKIVGVIIAIAVVLGMMLAHYGFSLTEIVTMFSAMVVAVSAATTAYFAYKGLSIWKEQHSGKIESDLATRLLVSIYKYRDAIFDYANPFTLIQIPQKDTPNLSKEYRATKVRENLENDRHDKVVSTRQEIYADILASEALWGKEMQVIFEGMQLIEKQLKIESDEYMKKLQNHLIEITKMSKSKKPMTKQEMGQIWDEIQPNEATSKELKKLVKKAEDYLRPKILLQNQNPPPQLNTKKGTT